MSDSDWLSRAEGTNPAEAVNQGISGVILAFFGAIIALMGALEDGLSDIIGVMGDFRDFVAAFFTSPIQILNETADHSAMVLTEGDWAFFGPGTWAVGVAAIVLGFWVWTIINPKIPILDNLLPWR